MTMATRNRMTESDRNKFLNQLTESERKTFQQLRDLLAQPKLDLKGHHRIGKCVKDLGGKRRVSGRYGWFTDLATALGYSFAALSKARAFAREYSAAEVKRLARKGVTWSMMVAVFPLKDKAKREELLTRALEDRWTVEVLQGEV